MRMALAASAAASFALLYLYKTRRRPRVAVIGSQTNASDAVDQPQILPGATPDDVLDVAVEYTFPASDPIAITDSYAAALRREDGA
jgi:hypothetical protein